jgi:hypothetical protein
VSPPADHDSCGLLQYAHSNSRLRATRLALAPVGHALAPSATPLAAAPLPSIEAAMFRSSKETPMIRPLRTAILGPLAIALTLSACGGRKDDLKTDLAASKVTTIGVNSYLWRASLDTLSFMPLLQTDSNGGVIVSDWYVNPATPTERMKVTVSILDQDLRADALRVAALRQVQQNGQWVEAPVQAATVQKLEDIILTRARDLRRGALIG